MAVLKNRAKMSTSTTGTGTITLGSAESGYQTFADAGVANADVVRYIIEDTGGAFEIGTGTYTATGTTLSRTVSESSNSDAAINLSGSATVFIGATAEDIPKLYAANESSPSAQPSATGSNAIAIGDSSVSGGTNSFSGPNSRAAGAESVAIGISSNSSFSGASNSGGVAIGRYANSTGVDSISLGKGTNSTAQQTLALGYEATASNTQAVAIQASRSTGTNSLAIQTEGPNFYGATASYSIAIGRRAQSNGSYSVAIGGFTPIAGSFGAISLGYETVSNGTYATVLGNRSTATAQSSVALGTYANSDIQGKLAYSSERFGLTGDSQAGLFVLRCDTTDATPEKLQTTAGTQSVGSTNQVVLPNDSVFGFTGTVIARENSSQTDDFAVWEIKGGAVRGANAASTTLGSYNINKISESAGATNWSIALSADTTNGAVSITVTGEASHSIRWVATINTTEVTY